MSNLYYCPECNIYYIREYDDEKRRGYCNVTKRPTTMEKVKLDCSKMYVGSYGDSSYVYIGGDNGDLYLHKDGVVRRFATPSETGWYGNKLAEENLRRFKEKMCSKDVVVRNGKVHLQLENETAPVVQPITARLVSDKSGGRIVLQVQTSETPEFIPVARLGVKNGKVVMYRERGVESEFINTDSEGRIQN